MLMMGGWLVLNGGINAENVNSPLNVFERSFIASTISAVHVLHEFMYSYWSSILLMFPSLLLSSFYSSVSLSDLTWIESSVSFILLRNLQQWHAGLKVERVRESRSWIPSASPSPRNACWSTRTQATLACGWERRSWGGVWRSEGIWGGIGPAIVLLSSSLTSPDLWERGSFWITGGRSFQGSVVPQWNEQPLQHGEFVLSCFKCPLSGAKSWAFWFGMIPHEKQSRIKQVLRHSDEAEVGEGVDLLKG